MTGTEFAWFLLSRADGMGAKTLHSLWRQCRERRTELADLLEMPAQEIAAEFSLSGRAARGLKEALAEQERAEQEYLALESQGVRLLTLESAEYPRRLLESLGEEAPPLLYTLGEDLDLLNGEMVAVVGSRNASEQGLAAASRAAASLAENEIAVVSGYAKGIDTAAHGAALKAGGATVMVLGEGIFHFRMKGDLAGLDDYRGVVISQFAPGLPWSAGLAMARNKTVCGLASGVIAVESGAEGGTWHAAITALEMGKPLLVAELAAPGNALLIERGGRPWTAEKLTAEEIEFLLTPARPSREQQLKLGLP